MDDNTETVFKLVDVNFDKNLMFSKIKGSGDMKYINCFYEYKPCLFYLENVIIANNNIRKDTYGNISIDFLIKNTDIVNKLKLLNDSIIDNASKNSLNWFKECLSKEELIEKYSPPFNMRKTILRTKCAKSVDSITTSFNHINDDYLSSKPFDNITPINEERVLEHLKIESVCDIIVKFNVLYINSINNKFGVSVKLEHINIKNVPSFNDGFCSSDESIDEDLIKLE